MSDQPFSNDFQNYNLTPINSTQENPVPLLVNTPTSKVEYKTPREWSLIIGLLFFFISGLGASLFLIIVNFAFGRIPVLAMLGPLIFPIFAIIIGSFLPLYDSIEIDNSVGTIIIKKIKFSFCFNKSKTINISEVRQVIIKNDCLAINNEDLNYNTFEIIFILENREEIKGCKRVDDKNGEGNKAVNIIRSGLPQNISFTVNLV